MMSFESATRDFQLNPNDPLLAERYLKTLARHAGIKALASCQFHEPSAKNWKCVLLSLAEVPEAARETCLRAFECVLSDWPLGIRVLPRWSECADGGFESPLSIASLFRFGAFQLIDSLDLHDVDLGCLNAGARCLQQLSIRDDNERFLGVEFEDFEPGCFEVFSSRSPFPSLRELSFAPGSEFAELFFSNAAFVPKLQQSIRTLTLLMSEESCFLPLQQSTVLLNNLEELQAFGDLNFSELIQWPWQALKNLTLALEFQTTPKISDMTIGSEIKLETLTLRKSKINELDHERVRAFSEFFESVNSNCELILHTGVISNVRDHDWQHKDLLRRVLISERSDQLEFPEMPNLSDFVMFSRLSESREQVSTEQIRHLLNSSPKLRRLVLSNSSICEALVTELREDQRLVRRLSLKHILNNESVAFFAALRSLELESLHLHLKSQGADLRLPLCAELSQLQAESLSLSLDLDNKQSLQLFSDCQAQIHKLRINCEGVVLSQLQEFIAFECFQNLESLELVCDNPDILNADFWQDLSLTHLQQLSFSRLPAHTSLSTESLDFFATWPSLLDLEVKRARETT